MQSLAWIQKINSATVLALIYIIIFATVISYWLHQYIIKVAGPVMAAMSLYINPAAAYLWAAVLLGEKLTWGLFIGTLLTLTGAWLTTKK